MNPITNAKAARVISEALNALGLALVEHGHKWTNRQRQLYERAISYAGYTDSDLSVLETNQYPKRESE